MFFVSRGWNPPRVALATATFLLILVASGLPALSSQPGTPVASPGAGESATTLPPAWLEFGPDGRLIARVIIENECPALVLDGLNVGMTRRAPTSDAFPVVACETSIPFGTATASILDQSLPLPEGPVR